MAHALPTPPGRRLARTIGVAAVIVVLAVVLVGLVVRNRHTRNASGATTATSSTTSTTTSGPVSTTPSPAPTTTPPITPTTTPTTPTTPTTAARSTAASSTPTTGSTTTSPATPAKVDLVVMNNTGRAGLATTARARFEAQGWKVTDVANFSGDVISTCAFYDPNHPGDKQAAEALRAQFPAIKRVEPRFSRLPAAPIVVVLTDDYH